MKQKKIFTNYFDTDVPRKGLSVGNLKKGKILEDLTSGKDDVEKEDQNIKVSYKYIYLVCLLVFSIISFKLFDLQLIKGDYYYNLAKGNRIRYQIVRAPRGIIYDKNEDPLVKNVANFQVVLEPFDVPDDIEKRNKLFESLSLDLGIKIEEIKKQIPDDYKKVTLDPKIIKENLDQEAALKIKMKYRDYPAVEIESSPTREYFSKSTAHVLGYISRVSEKEYSENQNFYDINDYAGKFGLEASYEQHLKGENGRQMVEVDAQGRIVRILGTEDQSNPKMGNNLITSLDKELQGEVTAALQDAINKSPASSGSVVIMNPKNGNILSMVSLPSFDNNLFAKGIKSEDYQSLINDSRKPLFNRSISGAYEPGSTIKPVIAAAGLEENVITPSTTVNSTGRLVVKNQYDPSIEYIFRDWKASGHGITNVYKAIAESVNTFFYYIGGGFENFKGLGASRLEKYLKLFGLGGKTGVDLNNEVSGLVPTPEWKKQAKNESWYMADNYQLAIGQGALLVTPIQVCNYLSAIANGGVLYQPKLVEKITDSKGQTIEEISPNILKNNFLSKESISVIREGMRQAVLSGSARSLNNLPFSVAGKTGTAQYGPNNSKQHAWFTAFAPYEDPEIAIVVLVEGGGEGSEVAVPVARRVLEYYFKNK